MTMSDLPSSWQRVPIGQLCVLRNGKAFKPTDWGQTGLPIVRIQNLNNPDAPYNHFAGTVDEKFLIENGDLLFAWSGTPGTSFGAHIWSGSRAVLNQHIFKISFDERVIFKKFFKYAINQKLNELIQKAHGGVGLRHVTKGKFEETKIELPPISEQKQIVSKIEELFSAIDDSSSNMDLARRQLGLLQQVVLEKTFGRTSDRRPLPSLLTIPMSNGYSGKPVKYPTKHKVLGLSATTNGTFRKEYFKYLDEDGLDKRDIWCEHGDILVQRGNTIEYVGVPAMYTAEPHEYIFPDLMIRLRANVCDARVSAVCAVK